MPAKRQGDFANFTEVCKMFSCFTPRNEPVPTVCSSSSRRRVSGLSTSECICVCMLCLYLGVVCSSMPILPLLKLEHNAESFDLEQELTLTVLIT
jgi:hypothetical protein